MVGIAVGLVSAIRRYSLIDRLTTVVTAAASAIPVFVLGYLLQYGFAVYPEPARLAGVGRLRTSTDGPGHVDFFFIPDRRAVALPDPAGDHAGVACRRRWRPA